MHYILLIGASLALIGYAAKMQHNAPRPTKFPAATKDHINDDPTVVSYTKFRARRVYDEKERIKTGKSSCGLR